MFLFDIIKCINKLSFEHIYIGSIAATLMLLILIDTSVNSSPIHNQISKTMIYIQLGRERERKREIHIIKKK